MSQLPLSPFIPNPVSFDDWQSWARQLTNALTLELAGIKSLFLSKLTFGDGTAIDNVSGAWLKDQVTNATPDTETAFTHNLGVVPVGILVVKQDKGGVIYAGSTTWTTTSISLKCSVASVTFTAFLLNPPTEIA